MADTPLATITVTAVNDAPVISSSAPTTAIEDVPYTYNATVDDPDGPSATWNVAAGDTCGGSIGSGTGIYTFTAAGPSPPPSCDVNIEVCDGATPSLCDAELTNVTIGPTPVPALSLVPRAVLVLALGLGIVVAGRRAIKR